MTKRAFVAVLMLATPAAATDPCEEARWAGGEIIAHQSALTLLLEVRLEHCKKAPKHPACPSFEVVSAAVEGGIDKLSAVRSFRKKECAGTL